MLPTNVAHVPQRMLATGSVTTLATDVANAYSLCNAQCMANANLIGSAAACAVLDIDKSTLSRWVKAGTITPAQRLPGKNGAMLFRPSDVTKVCLDRAALAK